MDDKKNIISYAIKKIKLNSFQLRNIEQILKVMNHLTTNFTI